MNRFQFKLLLTVLMVLDHIQAFVPDTVGLIFHAVSRVVAVGFAYLAVEGFLYTKDLKKYLLRLYGGALIMATGNYILNTLVFHGELVIYNNIFFTLALGVSLLGINTEVKNPLLRGLATIVLYVVGIIFSEGGLILLPLMLLTYLFRNDRGKLSMSYMAMAMMLFIAVYLTGKKAGDPARALREHTEYLFFFILPLLQLYNGEPGPKAGFAKYFFYVFYPLHLWGLHLLEYSMM